MRPRKTRLAIAGFFGILLLLEPAVAQDGTLLTNLENEVATAAQGWETTVMQAARAVFWILAGIEIGIAAVWLALAAASLDTWFAELVRRIMFIGLFVFILEQGPDFARAMVDSLFQIGAGGGSASPANVFNAGLQVASSMSERAQFGLFEDNALAIAAVFSMIVVVIAFSLVAAIFVSVMVEMYVGLLAGMIMLGLGGSSFTKDFAVRYLVYAFSVGMKLMALVMIARIGSEVLINLANDPGASDDYLSTLAIAGISVVVFVIAMYVPNIVQGVVQGVSVTGGMETIRHGGQAASMAAGGAALAWGGTALGTIEQKIRALGYTPVIEQAETKGGPPRKRITEAWWKGSKGRLVLLTGALFMLAFAIARILPDWEQWLYSGAALISVIPFARRAVAGAMSGSPFTIETLMTVAALGAVAIGEAEEAAVVIFLFAVGELLETVAAGRARAGIEALIDLVPRVAFRERDGVIEQVAAEELAIGDVVVVRPGDRVPSDGTVIDGASEVDEAPVTGESMPVLKEAGANVYAGSINANGELRVSISHVAADNTIARIIHMVEEAQESKAPTARMIDRFSRWYTPGAMVVAALIVVVPPLAFGGDWMTWVYRGLATLLIACPCALVISTPAAIASGLAAGARQGLLIKGGAALEILGKVVTVAFDKTGTLTRGHPQVTDIVPINGDENAVLAIAAAVERSTSHPLGVAIVEAAKVRGLELPVTFGGGVATPGKAVTARLKDGFASVGSPRHAAEQAALEENIAETITTLESQGKTVVVLIKGKTIEGLIALRDEPRDDAIEGVKRLTDRGVRPLMLTGDNKRTADAIAAHLGLEASAELLPDAKLAEIGRLKANGPIAMVGDGINDAPALAAASVGVAMGAGTDVALETADAALLRNRVTGVADLIGLSQATLGNIWQNIAIALGLKAVFLVTTLFGITTLWMAILADTGATVLVTANALRLLTWRGTRDK